MLVNFIRIIFLLFCLSVSAAHAQDLRALARVDTNKSDISDVFFRKLEFKLQLSQAVPFRIFSLSKPNRIVFDFKEIDWADFDVDKVLNSKRVKNLKYGAYQAGWSRLVIELSEPMLLMSSEMVTDTITGTATFIAKFKLASPEEFAKNLGPKSDAGWDIPNTVQLRTPKTRQIGDRPLVVVLDPGHGGIDSGAKNNGHLEKDLVLLFSKELKEKLILTGRYKAFLTRDDDHFISLIARISKARELNADLMISLHADALESGWATGTTVYSLSDEASDEASAFLASRQDRADLLAGVDLNMQSDAVANVLMELAQLETKSRSDLLADMIVSGVAQSIGQLRKRPHLYAGFTVLKAPDIPSVLVELGFMSNERDLNNLLNPAWRQKVIEGIILALDNWAVEDAAQAQLLRQ